MGDNAPGLATAPEQQVESAAPGALDPALVPRSASQILGQTLWGHYRVVEPISSGATGAVFRAVDTETGASVAIKRSTHPDHDHRFEIEAGLLASLQHPRVVKI